ncbi:hypothetical protein D6853_08545 [Butyrivibrio sp. X503]|uniref:hypothetical protein n=1 Tax=Butyrivibrio sp. X503 TaxID=2364878 RepID=UPI000EA8CD77|nr:hypothetical protein [Butyrivibrio sp. X503]RKM55594.1 hypothetical protein D6853_08545 [Butyrivibrio sp. X503]
MKKRLTATVIAASALMLTLMGCAHSAGEDPFESEAAMEESETESASEPVSSSDSSDDFTDDSFVYKDQNISILNDAAITLGSLGDYDKDGSFVGGEYKNYSFDKGAIAFDTTIIDGKESPVYLYLKSPSIKTAKGVGVGDSKEDILSVYGDPNDTIDDGIVYSIEYQFDTYNISFVFDDKKEKVEMVIYKNNYYYSKTKFN